MKGFVTAAVPKVSVAMITYNHEKFIAQAIESVLMQQVDFPIEIIIGEDCSTDGTRDIVKRYAGSNPEIIRPLLNTSNIGAQRNLSAVLNACRGEYIACLEGDDYWTDPRKLQKQVALMDLNPQYAMCGTAARDVAVSPDGKEREGGLFPGGNTKRLYNLEDVLVEHPFRALTFMLRNGLVRLPDWFETVPYGDMCILALYAEKGPIACLNEVTGAYRMHAGGIWSGCSMSEKCKAIRKTLDILNRHFSGRYIKTLRDRDFRVSKMICLGGVNKGRNLEAIQAYWGSFCRFAPYMPVSYLMLGFLLIWLPLRTRFAVRTRVRRLLRGCKRH